jgi:hypothetical protein
VSLTEAQKKDIRAAIYVYTTSVHRERAVQEKFDDLNSAILDDSWGLWYDFAAVQALRDYPENEPYRASIQALLDIIGNPEVKPPPIEASPEPEPHEDSYDTPASHEPSDIAELRQELAALKAVVAAMVTSGALANVVPVNGSGGDVGFQFNTGSIVHRLYGNPEDSGLRLWFNYREPYVNGSSYAVPSLPQMALFFEQDGVVSFPYFKPKNTPDGPYDRLGGKALAIRGGGWRDDGQREKNVSIYGGQVGRGLQLGIARTRVNWVDRFDVEIDADDAVNPLLVTVEGQQRRVRMRPDGSLYAE